MIVITGAGGFIASNLVSELNRLDYRDLILVDDFSKPGKNENVEGKTFTSRIERNDFFSWMDQYHRFIQFIFHIGARTDTSEFDMAVFDELNLEYSKRLWEKCVEYGIAMVYASSAATYGMGEHGYIDSHELVQKLEPLNPYGVSKNEFDKWVLKQKRKPYYWAGLKYFNVYGPNEYHKGRMASVIFHAFNQIKETGKMKLFRSHHPDFKDGEQKRDFIYVKDVTDVMYFLMKQRKHSGIYNLGTGQARTFLDLTRATFWAMNKNEKIEFMDTPEDIRDKYQYFTEANMTKLKSIGYTRNFYSIEAGVSDYVTNYLLDNKRN
jgi:ADP-L-glycero-D-manno-heptose 6-epimerase